VAATPNGQRRNDRIATLMGKIGKNGAIATKGVVPGCVQALVNAGLMTLRRSTPSKDTTKAPGWWLEITPNGQLTHRAMVANLRSSAVPQ
jgi:hypothetical protein